MARRKYTAEFKGDAVRQFGQEKGNRSARQMADELGIAHETLSAWIRQAQIDSGTRDGLTTEERERLRSLGRENRILQEEREIPKKQRPSSHQCQSDIAGPAAADSLRAAVS